MKKLKKFISTLLCTSMLLPMQMPNTYASIIDEAVSIEEMMEEEIQQAEVQQADSSDTVTDEESPKSSDELEVQTRFEKMVSFESEDSDDEVEEWGGEPVIYWNPSGSEQFSSTDGLGSPSDSSNSNASGNYSGEGSDHANGLTPQSAVRSLNTAIRRAGKLSDQLDMDISDITIYAMRPMIIPDGVLYAVNGKGVTVSAWAERDDESDLVFAVDGGQLVLSNIVLAPFDGGKEPAKAELIYMNSGSVKLGENISSLGTFVLDYGRSQDKWGRSTLSETVASGSQTILATDPIIELSKTFDSASEYILDIRSTGERESVTAVHALYSDASPAEEFMELFDLVDDEAEGWKLIVEERVGGVLRDTTEEGDDNATAAEALGTEAEALRETMQRNPDAELTQKSLVATRAARSRKVVYWNPGPELTIGAGETYPEGRDIGYDGSIPEHPVKTWKNARERANGGIVICMQTIDFTSDATDVLGPLDGGAYVIDGLLNSRVTLSTWERNPVPILKIPVGVTVKIQNIDLIGQERSGQLSGTQMIRCAGGELILNKNVRTGAGYIQLDLEDHQITYPPMVVNDSDVSANVFVSGINEDINWRYQDVVIAGPDLLGVFLNDREDAGTYLLDNIILEAANSLTIAEGGTSNYMWELRKDTTDDDAVANPDRLEIFAEYYFDAVYINGVNGSPANYGSTCEYPVDTFETAKIILEREIARSVSARAAAALAGENPDSINLPKTIYICDTITVQTSQTWTLGDYTDWDNTAFKVEIKSHTDIPSNRHQKPKLLVHIKGSQVELTLGKNILIRSITDESDSYSIAADNYGRLILDQDATITGLINQDATEHTKGVNLLIGRSSAAGPISTGYVNSTADWSGSIDSREVGVQAYGQYTLLIMEGTGTINNHHNPGDYSAGVYLGAGSRLDMYGIIICDNSTELDGAGIYLDEHSVLEIVRGKVERNRARAVDSAIPARGVGVFIADNAYFIMGTVHGADALCVIADQDSGSIFKGLGVYVAEQGIFTMNSGIIRDNKGSGSSLRNLGGSYGGGVYNVGEFTVYRGDFTNNGGETIAGMYPSCSGAGIYLGGHYQVLSGIKVTNNSPGNSGTLLPHGGGIYVRTKATITDCIIEGNGNSLGGYGGGIYIYNGTPAFEVKISKTEIRNNAGRTSGGGIYIGQNTRLTSCVISGNTVANGDGGGIYSDVVSKSVYCVKTEISGNTAGNGAGIYNNSTFYATDVTITNNIATKDGGGIYYGRASSTVATVVDFFLDESAAGKSLVSGNRAARGGGIFANSHRFYYNITNSLQNTAVGVDSEGNSTAQGNNIYLESSHTLRQGVSFYFLKGGAVQPADAVPGVYNVFLNTTETSPYSAELILDPQVVSITGADRIYLYSVGAYLKYLKTPPSSGNLPVDLNEEKFNVGSIVIKPAGIGTLTVKKVNSTNTAVTSTNINYGNLTDASGNLATYSAGSKVPNRTFLAGYTSGGTTNVILMAAGVYLDGINGSDTNAANDGSTPQKAVKTFAKAKSILEQNTTAANGVSGGEGFNPVIYICGTVTVSSDMTWILDYDAPMFTTQSAYVRTEEAAGRVPEKAQIKRFTSYVSGPLIKVSGGSANLTLTIEKLIIDGMTDAVVRSEQSSRSPIFQVDAQRNLVLQAEAQIKNNSTNMINVSGTLTIDSTIPDGTLVNGKPFVNRQVEVAYGDGVNLARGGEMNMTNYARIIMTRTFSASSGQYSIQGAKNRGVVVDAGAAFTMKDYSKIQYTTLEGEPTDEATNVTTSSSFGVVLGSGANSTYMAALKMLDHANISGFYGGIAISNYDVDIELSGYAKVGASPGDQGNRYGIYTESLGKSEITITMDENCIIGNNVDDGIYFSRAQATSAESDLILLKMLGNSTIKENGRHGISFGRMYSKIQIDMEGTSHITNNVTSGIKEEYASRSFELNMSGGSWIGSEDTGSQKTGIYLYFSTANNIFSGDKTDTYVINMSEDAMIGGDQLYSASSGRKGNSINGIYATKPFSLNMYDRSKICYNHQSGIQLAKIQDAYHNLFTGTTKINMGISLVTTDKTASIFNNGTYGIYSEDKIKNGTYNCDEIITIGGNSSIKDHPNGNEFMFNSSVYLKDNAYVGNSNNALTDVINMYGDLYLDGTTTVSGLIHLLTHKKPIILTKAVPGGSSQYKYKLHLSEGHVGEIVVKPDGVGVTNTVGYLDYFKNEVGDGSAANKVIIARSPNLVLEGNNDVYLSGNGNDNSNGMTPVNAVRTFGKARALLENGEHTDGANIIICDVPGTDAGVPVQVVVGDEDWSFVTGAVSWTPAVVRHSDFAGPMIEVCQGETTTTGEIGAASVTFKNITIDGMGSDQTIAELAGMEKMILKVSKGNANLDMGAVLRNNRLDLNGGSVAEIEETIMGVLVAQEGSLVIDGGTIENMILQNIVNDGVNPLGVAVYNRGMVELKQGLIHNSQISFASGSSQDPFTAAAILNVESGSFLMSGGTVSDNQMEVQDLSAANGGAVAFEGNASGHISGGSINHNHGGKGSAIYYSSDQKMELSGGRIHNNKALNNNNSTGEFSPVYINGWQFLLKVGGAILEDPIYLTSTDHVITLNGYLQQSSRRYQVYVNQGDGDKQYKKGSVVVQPDGDHILDTNQFLSYFDVHANPYILDHGQAVEKVVGTISGIREYQCLILMQAVFLDSVTGLDSQDGTTPQNAVKTFDRAKTVGEGTDEEDLKDYYVIYISGQAANIPGETWQLDNSAYMCRYTGFDVYKPDGTAEAGNYAHQGFMVVTAGDLNLENIRIFGRRSIDTQDNNGDSMILIENGHTVNMMAGAELARNYNVGSYVNANGLLIALQMKGGAVRVKSGGTLNISGGSITDVSATYGDAIFQEADESTFGKVFLDNNPNITGDIYLYGGAGIKSAYVMVSNNYKPLSTELDEGILEIRMENDYSGRPVVKYPDGIRPTPEQINYYQLDDAINAIYDFTYDATDDSLLVLSLRQILYVDPDDGNDLDTGLTPDHALATIKGVYEKIPSMEATSGVLVFIVNTLDITHDITLSNEIRDVGNQSVYKGTYKDPFGPAIEVDAQVYFKRYAQPTIIPNEDYRLPTNVDSLFEVANGATFSINGIYLDGHSEESISDSPELRAQGVEAIAPLITVHGGGILDAAYTSPQGDQGDEEGSATYTYFANNKNVNEKTNIIGNIDGEDIIEAISAGIEILTDGNGAGTAKLKGVEFRNLKLGDDLYGGTDVYQNGILKAFDQTIFSGSVLLEGFGTTLDPSTSRYIEVLEYGTPFKSNFKVIIRDPYNTRIIVKYPSMDLNGPADRDLGIYLLDERTNKYFALQKRETQKYILELIIPAAVYIDGQSGSDSNEGYVPVEPVLSLKKAYEQLQKTSGRVIYVVNTVDVTQTIDLGASGYVGEDGMANLYGRSNRIDIKRFVKPLAAATNTDYNVDDFRGTLIRVKDGGELTLKQNAHVDGHFAEWMDLEYPEEFLVDHTTEVIAPLIQVEADGILNIEAETSLTNNSNTGNPAANEERLEGGAIHNSGTVKFKGGVIEDNDSLKAKGIYQDGVFEIYSNPEGIRRGQEIYLTTESSGSGESQVWGEDHVIKTAVMLPDTTKLDVEMDHAVAGRPVVRYMNHSGIDAQHPRYELGNTVPSQLFLIECLTDSSLLELQNWRVLDVSVPKEMFLVIMDSTEGVVKADAAGPSLVSPKYSIKNNGSDNVKVSLAGFINDNAAAGITTFADMNLVALPSLAVNQSDLYLAVKGENTLFAALTETSLHDYGTDGAVTKLMGTLGENETGEFIFKATVSDLFFNYYRDPSFPLTGSTEAQRIAHMRNLVNDVTSANNARAKFKMTYRLELDPARRQP